MAEDNSQSSQLGNGAAVGGGNQSVDVSDTALPAWLVKAQKMAEYEAQRAPEVSQGDALQDKGGNAAEINTSEVSDDAAIANSDVNTVTKAEEIVSPKISDDVNDDVGALVNKDVPDWIKKASIQASENVKNDSFEIHSGSVEDEDNNSLARQHNDEMILPRVDGVSPKNTENKIVSDYDVNSADNKMESFENSLSLDNSQSGERKVVMDGSISNTNVEINQSQTVGNDKFVQLNHLNQSIQPVQPTYSVQEDQSLQPVQSSEITQVESSTQTVSTGQSVSTSQVISSDKNKAPLGFIWNLLDKMANKISQGQTAGVPVNESKDNTGAKVDNPEIKAGSKEDMNEKQKVIEAEKIFQQGIATIRDLIAPSSMEIKYDSLRVEGLYCQTFYVYAYPRYLDTNWLSPVVNFDVTMDVAQFIYPIESATIMRVLKKKVTQMQSAVRMNAEKGMVSDPALETALQDAEELRVQIQRGQEKFFQFALYFTIYADEDKKLIKIAKQIESMLGGKLVLTKKCDLQMEHGFNSTLPLCIDELEVFRNMNTSPLSSTFPFSSADLTSNDGILYGLNRHNDSLVIFDRFSLENANSVVFAKSGAGKSYAVKLEILRSMMVGTDVIVIDPENEYEALAQTVGGAYLKVSLTSDRRINPFDLPSPLDGDEVQPGDLLKASIINLHGLLKIMLGGVSPEEEGILDKALNDVYALKGITANLVNPAEYPPPTMEDLYDILASMEGGLGLAQRLQKYTTGTYSGIFNKPTNVDLESGLMVFCIRDLEDALRPTAMYIILNYIWNKVRSKLKKRLLVIDEAWTMMQFDDSARFLFGLVKRARKYYLGITTITQDVEDFVKSTYGKPVITNSSMQLLLKQAPAAMEYLTKIFNLTEGEKYMLLNSGVGQGLFFAGLKHVALQIIASYTEDKIVTTNPEEILKGRESNVVYEGQ